MNKTYVRFFSFFSFNYVYGQYPEMSSSSPPVPPCCAFEELFTIADPQGSSRPKIRVYPRVEEIVSKTQDRSAKLAHESKPIHRVLLLKRRSFSVADDLDYTT